MPVNIGSVQELNQQILGSSNHLVVVWNAIKYNNHYSIIFSSIEYFVSKLAKLIIFEDSVINGTQFF